MRFIHALLHLLKSFSARRNIKVADILFAPGDYPTTASIVLSVAGSRANVLQFHLDEADGPAFKGFAVLDVTTAEAHFVPALAREYLKECLNAYNSRGTAAFRSFADFTAEVDRQREEASKPKFSIHYAVGNPRKSMLLYRQVPQDFANAIVDGFNAARAKGETYELKDHNGSRYVLDPAKISAFMMSRDD